MRLTEATAWPDKADYGASERNILSMASSKEPLLMLGSCPNYEHTPLHSLGGLSQELQVSSILLKDESKRLGLQSFKALGGCYAIAHTLMEYARVHSGKTVDAGDLLSDDMRSSFSSLTFACATDGNHGRSVAAGARLFGARSVVFLPRSVAQEKIDGILKYGAEIVQTDLDYDGAVAKADQVTRDNDWILISDTSANINDKIPQLVMHGYTVIVAEILQQLEDSAPPTHVFIQGGVGGLAAAVTGCLADVYGRARPTVIIVEPEGANCLQHCAEVGRLERLSDLQPTRMAMLECGEPSAAAWPIIARHVDFFLGMPDTVIEPALQRLMNPLQGDPPLDIGESGIAGRAGLLTVAANPEWRERIRLDDESRILVFGTEGSSAADRT